MRTTWHKLVLILQYLGDPQQFAVNPPCFVGFCLVNDRTQLGRRTVCEGSDDEAVGG